jgi:hypothetical protein
MTKSRFHNKERQMSYPKFKDYDEYKDYGCGGGPNSGQLPKNTQVQFKATGETGGVVQGGAYRSLISYAAPRGSGALWQQDWFDNSELRIAE